MNNLFLNQNQSLAADHYKGPMMVLAGPGSGKTTVITYRVKNLIETYNVDPGKILVITFTKAATEEMALRFKKIIENDHLKNNSNHATFSTFHSFFFRVLRKEYGYSIDNVLKDEERYEILKTIISKADFQIEIDEDFMQNVMNEIGLIKNELIEHQYYNSVSLGTDDFLEVLREYEKIKEMNNKIDFDDMLIKCYHLFIENKDVLKYWQRRYEYILVDEFQDINKVQYECLKLISQPLNNLFIVGDDDQSIYRFRGARPDFLINFPKDYKVVTTVILNINYRSTDEIIELCNKSILLNKMRYTKEIQGTNKKGIAPRLIISEDINSEAKKIADGIKIIESKMDISDIAVIYRTNLQARAFVDSFMNYNIAYKIKDEMPTIYEHFIAKDILAYIKGAIGVEENESIERILNKPKRYINKALIAVAKRKTGSLLNNLYEKGALQVWQLARVEELLFYLGSIQKRNPYDAIKYIRQAVGYDEYIKEYADYRKMDIKGLYEIVNELLESAKGFTSLHEYIAHVEAAIIESKDVKRNKNNKDKKGVTLTTMHSAKGLEFKVVFIVGAVEGVIPHEKSKTAQEIEEERRLFYVGMTRSKERLYLSIVNNRYELEAAPSRFLEEIGFVVDKKNK